MIDKIVDKGLGVGEKLIDAKAEQNRINKELADIETKALESARQREVELNKISDSSWLSRNISAIIAAVVVVAGVCSWFISVDDISKGYISSALMLILSYYFGSTTSKFRSNAIGHERAKNRHELALKKEEERTKRETVKEDRKIEREKIRSERRSNRTGLFNRFKKEKEDE